MIRRVSFAGSVGLIALLGLALRFFSVPPVLPDLDAVNFAEALVRFDLSSQAPHFPGYPVYVLLARLLPIAAGETLRLAFPGAILSALAIFFVGLGIGKRLGGGAGLAAAVTLAFAPLAILLGGAPSSDAAGMGLLTLGISLVLLAPSGAGARGWMIAAGLLAGLALGARPGLFAAAALFPWVAEKGARPALFWGLVAGVLVWALPFTFLVGPSLIEVGPAFLQGHASSWGGTLWVDPDLGNRFSLFGFDLFAAGLGLAWPGFVSPTRLLLWALLAGGFLALRLLPRNQERREGVGDPVVLRILLLVFLPYAAWILVGQNLVKARHVLPLITSAAIFAGWMVHLLQARGEGRIAHIVAGGWTLTLGSLLLLVSVPLAASQGREAAPAAELLEFARASLPPEGTMIFTGEEGRLFFKYAPEYRVGRPENPEALLREAERLERAGVSVYVTSQAPGATALLPFLLPLSRFRCDPLVRSYGNDLTLFRYVLAERNAS